MESKITSTPPQRPESAPVKNVVYVDQHDNVVGEGPREAAWEKGIPLRIARIFVLNSKGEVLISKRAANVSSNPGKWDQSAGGHVDAGGEEYLSAAIKELSEELGVEDVKLEEREKFYTANQDTDGKIKKRFNMLYTTVYDGEIKPNPKEISEVQWIDPQELEKWMEEHPEDFTGDCIETFEKLLVFLKNTRS